LFGIEISIQLLYLIKSLQFHHYLFNSAAHWHHRQGLLCAIVEYARSLFGCEPSAIANHKPNVDRIMANQSLDQKLLFVQVKSDAAYIDSRVYCRDVIQVDHADWFSNVLKKYQSHVESRFGSIRFENGSKTGVSGKANPKPQLYAMLTEAQCNAFLTFSRNSSKVAEAKLDLIADFERAKALVRSQLEQQLLAQPQKQVADLENALDNFPNTLDKLWKVSGILTLSALKRRRFLHLQTFPTGGNIFHQVRGCAKQPILQTR
jgi:hypothetical protein